MNVVKDTMKEAHGKVISDGRGVLRRIVAKNENKLDNAHDCASMMSSAVEDTIVSYLSGCNGNDDGASGSAIMNPDSSGKLSLTLDNKILTGNDEAIFSSYESELIRDPIKDGDIINGPDEPENAHIFFERPQLDESYRAIIENIIGTLKYAKKKANHAYASLIYTIGNAAKVSHDLVAGMIRARDGDSVLDSKPRFDKKVGQSQAGLDPMKAAKLAIMSWCLVIPYLDNPTRQVYLDTL